MSTTVSLNGSNYSIPRTGDDSWSNTGGVDDFLVALSTGVLQKAGGAFTLTAEVNFGGSFGLKTLYYKSTGSNPASAGVVRLANAESIKWRNAGNSADLDLTVDSSNNLNFNGAPIVTLSLGSANTALVMNNGGTAYQWATIVNANISSSAAIAYSKLTLTGSVVNADVSSSAAIAYSKLALTGAIVNADVSSSAAIAYSKLSLTGSVVNADISSSAAIAYSKLALTGAILNADLAGSIAYSKLSLTGTLVNADISSSAAIAYSKLALSGAIATGDLASGMLVPITKGGTGQTTKAAAFDALSPNTTKGDFTAFGTSTNVRVAVGADGTVLTADAASTGGLKWTSPLTNPMTTLGDLISGGASGAATRLAGNTTTTKKVLTSTGSGGLATDPAWTAVDTTYIAGNTSGVAPAANYVGETVTAQVQNGSATSLTTATAKTVTSISLTAGEWIISGAVGFGPNTTTSLTVLDACVSLTTNTLPSTNYIAAPNTTGEYIQRFSTAANVPASDTGVPIPTYSIRVTSTTTFYLVARAVFTVSTMNAYGFIHARRIA